MQAVYYERLRRGGPFWSFRSTSPLPRYGPWVQGLKCPGCSGSSRLLHLPVHFDRSRCTVTCRSSRGRLLHRKDTRSVGISMASQAYTKAMTGKHLQEVQRQKALATLDPEEGRLTQRLRNGDPEAFREIVTRHHSALLGRARGVLSDDGWGEDAVQETWLAVVRGIHNFEGRCSLRTWLFSILDNRAKSLIKRKHRTVSLTPEMMSAIEGLTVSDGLSRSSATIDSTHPLALRARNNQETSLISREAFRELQEAIVSLSATQRNVLTLRVFQGCSAHSVSRKLGITEGNQRVLLHRARHALKTALEDRAKVRSRPTLPDCCTTSLVGYCLDELPEARNVGKATLTKACRMERSRSGSHSIVALRSRCGKRPAFAP